MSSFMSLAIEKARAASGSVPVGAVIVCGSRVISSSGNEMIRRSDPTAHAEILAIRAACSYLHSRIIDECDMYVTLEPCAMCAQAIAFARLRRLYFGAYDPQYGAIDHNARILDSSPHRVEIIGGVMESECGEILRNFLFPKEDVETSPNKKISQYLLGQTKKSID